jgi:hypothetical protein
VTAASTLAIGSGTSLGFRIFRRASNANAIVSGDGRAPNNPWQSSAAPPSGTDTRSGQ